MGILAVEDTKTVSPSWDWKASYVERLKEGGGLELFSEASVTPDTMLLMAGPPAIPNDGFQELLSPIGLVTDVTFNADNSLRPMWEMGTDKTYFTRGKTSYQLTIGAMVANKPSLMKLMTRQSPSQGTNPADQPDRYTSRYGVPIPTYAGHAGQFWTNMDTESTAAPFGILMLFKTKGGMDVDKNGDFVSAVYLEHCNLSSFSFAMNSQAVTLQENVTIMFDRMVSVDYSK